MPAHQLLYPISIIIITEIIMFEDEVYDYLVSVLCIDGYRGYIISRRTITAPESNKGRKG